MTQGNRLWETDRYGDDTQLVDTHTKRGKEGEGEATLEEPNG